MKYYVFQNSTQQNLGPYSVDEIHTYLSQKLLSNNDLAAPEGASTWTPIRQFPHLTTAIKNELAVQNKNQLQQRNQIHKENDYNYSSYEGTVNVPTFMLAIALAFIAISTLLSYALRNLNPALLICTFSIIISLGIITLVIPHRKKIEAKNRLKRKMENEFIAKYGINSSWQEALGSVLGEGGEAFAGNAILEGNWGGAILGIGTALVGKFIEDDPEIREKQAFAHKIHIIEQSIKRSKSLFRSSVILLIIGATSTLFVVFKFA